MNFSSSVLYNSVINLRILRPYLVRLCQIRYVSGMKDISGGKPHEYLIHLNRLHLPTGGSCVIVRCDLSIKMAAAISDFLSICFFDY